MGLLPARFSHWTPRYVVDRLSLWLWQKRHPDCPWLTVPAIELLESLLRSTDEGVEWGSGRSTLWFARRVKHLCSVEHNAQWFARVSSLLAASGLQNVSYCYRSVTDETHQEQQEPYVSVVEQFAPNSLDFALVDGVFRSACTLAVLPRLRPGGLLIVDNCERYLPSNSRVPRARSLSDGPLDENWARVAELVRDWRCVWTGNVVMDTAIWFKP